MAFGAMMSVIGVFLLVLGTQLRQSVFGGVLLIIGGAIAAVGVIFLGVAGLSME